MNWCFSDEVKIAHTNFVKRKTRKVYFRKTDQENCGCKLMYEGEEDFLIRCCGSVLHRNKGVSLISYSLLCDFTLDFREGCKKNIKKLTNVSFGLTYIHTP